MMDILLSSLAELSGLHIAMLVIIVLVFIATHNTLKETAAMRARREAVESESTSGQSETNPLLTH